MIGYCETTFDTILVTKDWESGSYVINDSLILTAGLKPVNKDFCNSIELRIEPISPPEDFSCILGDLYPPFKIYKPDKSEIITVIKNDQVILFRFPKNFCNEIEYDDGW